MGCARRDHREAIGDLCDQTVHNYRPVIGQHFGDARFQLIRRFDPDALPAIGFTQFHKVGQGV